MNPLFIQIIKMAVLPFYCISGDNMFKVVSFILSYYTNLIVCVCVCYL